jgi:hypothetical protein
MADDDKPPPAIGEALKTGDFGTALFPGLLDSLIGVLVAQAVKKLPKEKRLQAVRYLAELVWPGSTKDSTWSPTDGGMCPTCGSEWGKAPHS